MCELCNWLDKYSEEDQKGIRKLHEIVTEAREQRAKKWLKERQNV